MLLMKFGRSFSFAGAIFVAMLFAASVEAQSVSPAVGGARYATDAYPGFDSEEDNVKPERKEPHWWWWVCGGVKCATAKEQFAYCQQLIQEESYSAACRQLDNLVREWPTAPEACKAQQQLAELYLEKLDDAEEAFKEFRYLLDFYSLTCDYGAIADRLYQVANQLKLEGKEVMFVRFANTVDVRRAYETCVLRAPGAPWVADAMLTIAALREDEGKYAEAVKVYENLRNIHPDSEATKTALAREAADRMVLLNDFGYNRARCLDTADFMRMALRTCRPDDAVKLQENLIEILTHLENEAYREARFYDAPTRTKRSAISAYERFLVDYPKSVYADEVRARIEELKGSEK